MVGRKNKRHTLTQLPGLELALLRQPDGFAAMETKYKIRFISEYYVVIT